MKCRGGSFKKSISETTGDVIRVTTGSEYGYGPNWFNLTKTGQSVFYFKVQICSDAHLLLIEDNSNIDHRHGHR